MDGSTPDMSTVLGAGLAMMQSLCHGTAISLLRVVAGGRQE